MGNGSSVNSSRVIYIKIGDKREMIVFSRYSSSADIISLLKDAAGASPNSTIQLKTTSGALLAISPTMPVNTPQNAYILTVNTPEKSNNDDRILQHVLSEVAQQFNKAVNFEQYKSKLEQRLVSLENLVQREGIKLLEIEKCKKDISDVKNELYMAHKKMIDYNHLSALSDERKICLKRDVPVYPKYTLSQETIDYLKQPTFDIWHWEPNEMLCLLEHMYHELGLVKEFNMNGVVLKRWLLCVQENYRNNPFHNFRHCFCVTQMMYGIIHMCKLWEKVSREDLGIMITACICHDLDHPGYNNTYQINARTELAVRYNDISPLENHHCAIAFQILSNPEANIFANIDHSTFKRIRSGIIMLVLATDMARHSEILDSFKSKLDNFDFSNEDHLNSMKMVMIKCCDISNEVRPFEVSEPWVDCLLEEYFNQSDREKEEGLPVAPFMDREKVTKPTAQIGFIKFVLIPMFETIAKLFPQLEEVMVKPLKDARDRYESMKEEADRNKAQN